MSNLRAVITPLAPYGEGLTNLRVKFTPTQSGTPWQSDEVNNAPYVFRSVPMGNREWNKLVGGTVAWNQLFKEVNSTNYRYNYGADTVAYSDGVATFTAGQQYGGFRTNFQTAITKDHIYAVIFKAKAASANYQIRYNFAVSGSLISAYFALGTTYETFMTVNKCRADGSGYLAFQDTHASGWQQVDIKEPMFVDLTQTLNPTIADYVYSLEQATAGSGIQWLKDYDLIDDNYHAYSQGSLESVNVSGHVMTGYNIIPPASLDNGWINGYLSSSGSISTAGATTKEMTSPYIRIFPSSKYYFASTFTSTPPDTNWNGWCFYDLNKNLLGSRSASNNAKWSVTSPEGAAYIRISLRTYGLLDTLMFEQNNTWSDYVPYWSNTTALDSSVTLRGMLKKDADGNLYYDGDTYEWDGTVTRRFAEVDLGSLNWSIYNQKFISLLPLSRKYSATNKVMALCPAYITYPSTGSAGYGVDKSLWISYSATPELYVQDSAYSTASDFKTAMSGVYLVYELATPTTESADPYTNPQVCDPDGTEEWTDYGVEQGTRDYAVPVGHESTYAMAYPISGVDSFTVTANDGTTHTYPVTLSAEIYRGYVDMLTGEAVSDMASIAEYNGETISEPWLSSLDVYSAGATPTNGAQVVYPITPEEVTATITGDPTELGEVTSVTSTKGTVKWDNYTPAGLRAEITVINPFE